MGSVKTSILGRPRRLSRDRHANANYTVIFEEPAKCRTGPINRDSGTQVSTAQ